MTARNAFAGLIALGLIAGVAATHSLVRAGDEPRPAPRSAPGLEQPRAAEEPTADRQIAQRQEMDPAERPGRPGEARRGYREGEEDRPAPPRPPGPPAGPGGRPEDFPRRYGPGPMRPPFRPEQVEQFGRMVEMIERTRQTCFDPEVAAMIAVGGLKDDVPRKAEEVLDDLEGTLKKTNSLGVRNAIRLILRDLYRERGDSAKVLEHLRAMVAENDQALQARPPRPAMLRAPAPVPAPERSAP